MLSLTEPAVTEAEAASYLAAAGATGWPADAVVQAQAIIRGQRFVAGLYNQRWTVEFENSAAPDAVKHAICEAALVEAKKPGALGAPLPGKILTSVGKIGWTASGRRWDHNSALPPIIKQLLAGLIGPDDFVSGWAWT